MAKDKIADYDGATAGNNTDIGGISIAEGMLPSAVNNSMRELTRQLGAFADGTEGIDVLNLHDDDASASIKIQAPATVTTTTTFTLPDGDGTNGYALVTNGAGQLSWASAGGIANIVEDTTPQLGGTLDLNNQNITGTGNIDISGTVTADDNIVLSGASSPAITITDTTNTAVSVLKAGNVQGITGTTSNHDFFIRSNDTNRIGVAAAGDVSLYDSTGVTQGFYWDASTQRLGLGSTAPTVPLEVNASSGQLIYAQATSGTAYVRVDSSNAGSEAIFWARATNTGNSVLQFGDPDDSDVGWIKYEHSSNAMAFRTNAAERMRIDSSGNVGIGTTSPSYGITLEGTGAKSSIRVGDTTNSVNVDVRANSTGGLVRTASNHPLVFATNQTERMRIDSSGNVGIGTATPATALEVSTTSPVIRSTHSTSGDYLQLFHNGSGAYIDFSADPLIIRGASNTERLRIDSSGNLLVSKTAADISVVGVEARANGSLIATKDNDKPLLLNRLTSDGDLIELRKAGTVGGNIGIMNGNNLYIANNADNSGLQFGTGAITPSYDLAAQNNSVDLGSSSTKFKDAYFSGTVNATSYTGDGSSLTGIAAGATGGGSDEIFWENGQTVTTNYTITNGKNAMSAGPITINTGVTVTVGTGETWTVV